MRRAWNWVDLGVSNEGGVCKTKGLVFAGGPRG